MGSFVSGIQSYFETVPVLECLIKIGPAWWGAASIEPVLAHSLGMCLPRNRELLMTAAMSIKTPVMTLPLLPPVPPPQRRASVDGLDRNDKAAVLTSRLRRLSFAEILRGAFMSTPASRWSHFA